MKPFRFQLQKQDIPIILILSGFALARLFFLLRYHLAGWDESVYLAMGKYAYSIGSSGLWEVIRPVGLPLAVGWAWIVGLPYIKVAESISTLFATFTILLTYLIAKRVFGRNVAVLSAALLATSPWFYLYSSYILSEIPSSFFVLASILFFLKGRYFLSGFMGSIAMLFKFPNALVLIALFISVVICRLFFKRPFAFSMLAPIRYIAGFSLATVPFLVFNYLFYRPFTSNFADALFRPFILASWHQGNPIKSISGALQNYLFYILEAFRQHIFLAFAALFVVLFFWRKWYEDQAKSLLLWFVLVYLAYFSLIPNKDVRFLLLFLPAACILASAAFFSVLGALLPLRQGIFNYFRSFALTALFAFLAVSFFISAYKDQSLHHWWPVSEPEIVPGVYESFSQLGIEGPILTSDPVFAAYNDNLFLAYYDTSRGVPKNVDPSWNIRRLSAEAVVFSPDNFCSQMDIGCRTEVQLLQEEIEREFKPIYNLSFYDGYLTYYLYLNSSYNKTRIT